jgi:hypothetical protein
MSKFSKHEFRDNFTQVRKEMGLKHGAHLCYVNPHSRILSKYAYKYCKSIKIQKDERKVQDSVFFSDLSDGFDLLPDDLMKLYNHCIELDESLGEGIYCKNSLHDSPFSKKNRNINSLETAVADRNYRYIKLIGRIINIKDFHDFLYQGNRYIQTKENGDILKKAVLLLFKKILSPHNILNQQRELICNKKNFPFTKYFITKIPSSRSPLCSLKFENMDYNLLFKFHRILHPLARFNSMRKIKCFFKDNNSSSLFEIISRVLKDFSMLEELSITIIGLQVTNKNSKAVFHIFRAIESLSALKSLTIDLTTFEIPEQLWQAFGNCLLKLNHLESLKIRHQFEHRQNCESLREFAALNTDQYCNSDIFQSIEQVSPNRKKRISTKYKQLKLRDLCLQIQSSVLWQQIAKLIKHCYEIETLKVEFTAIEGLLVIKDFLNISRDLKTLKEVHVNLENLYLIDDQIVELLSGSLSCLPNLAKLTIKLANNQQVSDDGIDYFCQTFADSATPNLQDVILDLRGCDISIQGVYRFYALLPVLTVIHDSDDLF